MNDLLPPPRYHVTNNGTSWKTQRIWNKVQKVLYHRFALFHGLTLFSHTIWKPHALMQSCYVQHVVEGPIARYDIPCVSVQRRLSYGLVGLVYNAVFIICLQDGFAMCRYPETLSGIHHVMILLRVSNTQRTAYVDTATVATDSKWNGIHVLDMVLESPKTSVPCYALFSGPHKNLVMEIGVPSESDLKPCHRKKGYSRAQTWNTTEHIG